MGREIGGSSQQHNPKGLFIIAKRSLILGMDHYTFTVYRNVIAAVVFGPLALLFERNTRPGMTLSILYRILLLGLFGVLDQDLYYAGMKHTTATFATTIYNFLPVINFLLAFLLSFEKVKFRSLHGQAKVFGTLVSVGGVIIMTFIKEPVIELPWTKHKPTSAAKYHQNSIKGSLMILGACSSLASFNILHAKTLDLYPALLSLTAMISAAASIEGFIASVAFQKGINFTVWSIHWDIKLLAYVYGGILCSGLANYISGYILQEKGPVFLTSFNPLTTLIVAGMGSFILAEQLDLGKVVGGFVIVLGLYLVLWGKTKDDHGSSSMENTEEVTQNAHFQNDLELGSLDTAKILMALEELGSEIPDNEADKINSINLAVDFLASHPQAK